VARIAGVNIPTAKRFNRPDIYQPVRNSSAAAICGSLLASIHTLVSRTFSDAEILKIREFIRRKPHVEVTCAWIRR